MAKRFLRPPGERDENAQRRRLADAGVIAREAIKGDVCPNCGISRTTCSKNILSGFKPCCEKCEHAARKGD